MRLYLAVAVLMLAFIAYTEAQEATFEEKMADVGNQMSDFFKNMAARANAGIEDFQNSQFATDARANGQKFLDKMTSFFRGDGQ